MENTIAALRRSAEIKTAMTQDHVLLGEIDRTISRLEECIKAGGTVLSCGNGGSACDSIHLTEELVARFKRERPGIRAHHFQDPGVLTCWGNDYSYDQVFERQAETFCGTNDALIAISTSGNSENVIKAVNVAKSKGSFTAALTGRGGGKLAGLCDTAIVVPADETERIQEAHITIIHIICDALDHAF